MGQASKVFSISTKIAERLFSCNNNGSNKFGCPLNKGVRVRLTGVSWVQAHSYVLVNIDAVTLFENKSSIFFISYNLSSHLLSDDRILSRQHFAIT